MAPKAEPEPVIDVKTLHAKIGELTLENDFLSGALGKAGLLSRCRQSDCIAICRAGAQKDDRPHSEAQCRPSGQGCWGSAGGASATKPRPVSGADLKPDAPDR